MNKQRRIKIAAAIELLQQAQAIIEEVIDEEQEAFDNMPESFQEGERGEKMQEAIENLDGAFEGLYDVIEWAEQATE